MTRQTEIESQFLSEATACALQTAGCSFIFPMKKTRLTEKKRFVGTFPVAEDDRLGRDGALPKPPSSTTISTQCGKSRASICLLLPTLCRVGFLSFSPTPAS